MRPDARAPRSIVRRAAAAVVAVIGTAALFALLSPIVPPSDVAAEPIDPAFSQLNFDHWPKDGDKVAKPDLVLVLSGQTYGYLQKCGCSNPQKGGLERRYNIVQALKARGWEVVGLDVGDVPHQLPYTPTSEQTLTKYEVAMQAMKLMGYQATAVGEEELLRPLLTALAKYTLQEGNELPRVHAANIANSKEFPGSRGSALTASDVIASKGGLSIGVIGVLGYELTQKPIDRSVQFNPRTDKVIKDEFDQWAKKKLVPDVNVLLYQGPMEYEFEINRNGKKEKVRADAETAAKAFPEFQIVLCKTNDGSDATDSPKVVNDGKTMICQVGQKGQNVGVVGIYKNAAGTKLFYQRVAVTEEFDTMAAAEKEHPILKLLQDYSDTVKSGDYLSEMAKRKKLLSVQTQYKDAAFAGDSQCAMCHEGESAHWQKTKHAHAYDALVNIAKRPTGRQFDGECIVCHTVGYEYKTGYLNEKTTPGLKNVQCEACHGPANLHVAEEANNLAKKRTDKKYVAMLSPWKSAGKGAMPTVEKTDAMAKEKDPVKRQARMTPAENDVYLRVYQTCAKCHDIDNDPKFDLATYWKEIAHTGLAKKPKK